MLEWAAGREAPGLAVLIDHDVAEGEYSYRASPVPSRRKNPSSRWRLTSVGPWSA
jgi:hypothetical protein